jgi:FkbM family methyltransferase
MIRAYGFDVVRFDCRHHPEARRIRLMQEYRTSVVLDVGASMGQYAMHLRELGYKGRIVSFEPLRDEFAILADRASHDDRWQARNQALGEMDGRKEINVSAKSDSSSLLRVLPRHLESAPQAGTVGTQTIELRQLDTVFDEVVGRDDVPYLKLDTQGYEMNVLRGAARSLQRIDTIQLEMSLTPLYDGETSLPELVTWLYGNGFELVGLEPGHADARCGQLLQVDGIFHRLQNQRAASSRTAR